MVMKNVANCEKKNILRIYDLKGSTYNRQVLKNDENINEVSF